MAHLLLVEDDPGIAESTVLGLRRAGFSVDHASTGPAGMERALAGGHDLVVLDLNLPELSGYTILEALRARSRVPVVVITARTGLDPRLKSFALGADDLLPKPFWVEELVLRIRRRLEDVDVRKRVRWADVVVDPAAREVTVAGEPVAMTPSELDLLLYLVGRPNRAVSRAQLVEHALPEDSGALERTVDSHLARVRKKLGDAGSAIQTVFRVGYRFTPP
ncbi:MAG: response regulator transcription factor [Alphaproteobacteria bacterium]|nr:response regulator transcription factor [Alphaproteobacteria bacterium]